MNILTIGPRFTKKNKKQTGGIVVLFENWLEYCQQQNISIKIIDTNKNNYLCVILAYFSIIYSIIKHSKKYDVLFLHGTIKDYLFIAPWVVFIGLLQKKKVCLRKFAGSFKDDYEQSNRLCKNIYDYTLKHAHILFWETKALVSFGMKFQSNSYWFPNVRMHPSITFPLHSFSRKFVFISRIEKEKGIDFLKESFSLLGEGYHLDIYGPLIDYSENDLTSSNYCYKGFISPTDICSILSQYDVLILPSYWNAEGYPGIILEAYSVGVPVIASNIGGIPEIVKNGYNGILIPPQNSSAIIQAVKTFDITNYKSYSHNALESFNDFEANNVNKHIIQIIQSHHQ
ncbi:glycosyltransferase [Bacteroides acidifaciens]|uniref:glycosyltransferase n=1 Tax=Bacteroides acidifaciens TaxID=85831 RepID=UPI00258BE91B|nr:glycosyltransferase [Bacteroides acidifaciens]